MATSTHGTRTRYPLHALALVAGAGLLFLFNMLVGFLFMALVPPLIPVFVCVLFAGGCLLGNALKYATRVSVRQPTAMLQAGRHEAEVGRRAHSRAA
jgi:hypothetical protein